MDAYLFSGWYTDTRNGNPVDSCTSLILVGLEKTAAWKHYEECLLAPSDGEPASSRKIRKVVCAPVLDDILTENGPEPLDWDLIATAVAQGLEDAPLDQTEQGYWADCDQCLDWEKLPTTLDSLRRELPEEIRSGLNWIADREYVFIVQVLRHPEQISKLAEDAESQQPDGEARMEEDPAAVDGEIDDGEAPPSDVRDMELAVVVRARNAVTAAWLWKGQAQGTRLARNMINVSSWIETLIRDQDGVFRVAGDNPASP